MARNRKNQSAAVRFGPALKALLLCLFIGGSGVGYVWQQNQLLELGRQKVEKEKRRDGLRAQNDLLARQLAGLQSKSNRSARERTQPRFDLGESDTGGSSVGRTVGSTGSTGADG